MKIELVIPTEKQLDETEIKAHNSAIFAVFPRIEREIKAKMYEQLIQTYSENVGNTKTREEVIMTTVRGNGIMEGLAIILESFRASAFAHESESKKDTDFDRSSPISEV